MRRVLMVSPHFPPDTTAATHRVRLLAPHLENYGWRPTVLSIDPSGYEGAIDPALEAMVPPDLEVVRCRAWKAGWTRRLGIGDLGLRALSPLWNAARALFTRSRFEALFITTYPIYPALLGPSLKRRYGVPFILDLQDPWVGAWGRSVGGCADGTPDFKSRVSRALASRIEPIAVGAADALTAVSQATYEDALARVKPSRTPICETLPIGWDEGDFARADRRNEVFDPADGSVHLCYVGTLLPHGVTVVERLLESVRLLTDREPQLAQRLRLHFVGTSNQTGGTPQPRVMPLAERLGLGACVTERPLRVSYGQALRLLRDANAILVMGSTEPHYTASKLYPALLARRPILAIAHEQSSISSILTRIAREPSVRLVSFNGASVPADAVCDQLSGLLRGPAYDPADVDLEAASLYSAPVLAGRLAVVLDQVAAA